MNDILKEFHDEGMSASFNYADDTCKEWRIGDKHRDRALRLFDDNPEFQPEMRGIAKGFLWSLSLKRPEA